MWFVGCSPVVESVSVNSETQIFLPLLWALSLVLGSVFWTSEASLGDSLGVGVLSLGVGPMSVDLRTCLLMLPWAPGRFYTNLAWALSEG